jgi:hypothetical protein
MYSRGVKGKIRTATPAQADLAASNGVAAKSLNSALRVGLTDELDETTRLARGYFDLMTRIEWGQYRKEREG